MCFTAKITGGNILLRMGRPSFYSFLAGRGTGQRVPGHSTLTTTPSSHFISPWTGVTFGRVCLSVLYDWLWPCPGKMAGPSSCLESSVSSTEPDMRESVSARLVPAARSWSDVYFTRSRDLKLRLCSPGAGILKFFQGHGILDGSSSWTPHTETWHCAESSFSKSIFVDTTFWLKQRPDQKWVFPSCWFFSFPIVLAIFLLPKAIFNCVIVFKHFCPFLELFQDFFFNLIVICFSLPYSFSIFKIVGSCNCLKVSLMRGLLGLWTQSHRGRKPEEALYWGAWFVDSLLSESLRCCFVCGWGEALRRGLFRVTQLLA